MSAIVNAANCTVGAAPDGAYLVTKAGGAVGALDASAVSAAGLAGDMLMRAKPLGGGFVYVGLSVDPLAANEGTTVPWAVQFNGTFCRVSERGAFKTSSFPLATYIWIRRSGGLIQTLCGPELATAALKRSVADPGGPLFFDSSIANLGSSFEVKFGPPADFAARRPRRAGRLVLSLGF